MAKKEALVFEVKGKEAIFDMEKFCRLNGELTYIGRFANKETSEVIHGTIIQYKGEFYTTEIPFRSGIGSGPADKNGIVTTSVELFETDYNPDECKWIGDCPIRIHIWNTAIDDEGPIGSYAFYNSQMEEAKEVVKKHRDVDIFIDGVKKERNDFLES